MIKVEHLTKQFSLNKEQKKEAGTTDKFAFAVNDISFDCKPGEIFSLLGPTVLVKQPRYVCFLQL